MIAPDAVVVYHFFGLNLDAIFALVRIVVTPVIIVLTLRIPFKRKYHWMFLIVTISFLWFSVANFLAQLPTTATASYTWFWWVGWANSDVEVMLIYQFVVYFVSPKVSGAKKYVLFGAYGYVIALNWVPLVIDPSFVSTNPKLGQFGWTVGPGGRGTYLIPGGLDIYVTVLVVIIFYLLFRYYRSEKSPLVRGQTKYIALGLVFIFIGAYNHYLATYTYGANFPNIQNIIAGAGDVIWLLGLRKKGFYSVTPIAETSGAVAPISVPLEDGRSYLAHDSRTAFEDFSSLVRSGHQGLLITRTFPDDVRKDYGLQTTPIRWLADEKSGDGIPPGDLLGISLTVKDFLEKATKPVVMLHGIEYLTTRNGFTPILKLIHGLSESNAARRGVLILPVVPDSLSKQDEALLVAETTPLPMAGGESVAQ